MGKRGLPALAGPNERRLMRPDRRRVVALIMWPSRTASALVPKLVRISVRISCRLIRRDGDIVLFNDMASSFSRLRRPHLDEARTHMAQPMMYAYRRWELHEKHLSATGGAVAWSPAERPWLCKMRR